jgi:predicted ABC-type transport system involved in lysophospholipase L1 biosynthesis ATPase subunit
LLWAETRARGITVVLVTHEAEYAKVGDLVVRLRSGHVVDVHEQESPLQPEEVEV